MFKESKSNSETNETKKMRRRPSRLLVAAVGSVTVVMAIAGCDSEKINYGEANPQVTAVTIQDEAILRTEPLLNTSDNITELDKVKLDSTVASKTIPTPDGVYETSNNNGKWFGIKASDFPEGFGDAKNDTDGIIWVNEAKAKENKAPSQTPTLTTLVK